MIRNLFSFFQTILGYKQASSDGIDSDTIAFCKEDRSIHTHDTDFYCGSQKLGTAAYQSTDAFSAAGHTHQYLPLSGGTMTDTINSSVKTNTHLAGNKGRAIINSLASAGSYVMLAKMNSTNGFFTHGTLGTDYKLQYTAASVVSEGKNYVSYTAKLLDEGGNTSFPGTVTAPTFSGKLNGNANTASKWAKARTITIGNTGKSVNGSSNVAWSLSEIGAAPINHTHEYLPLSGGTVSGDTTIAGTLSNGDGIQTDSSLRVGGSSLFEGTATFDSNAVMNAPINSSVVTHTHIAGNQGSTIINSLASAGSYVMLAKMNSTNGFFTHGTFGTDYRLQYTAASVVSEGNNKITHTAYLLKEDGNTSFPGTVTAPTFSGKLNGNANTSSKWKTSRTITIGNTGKSVDGSRNVAWSLSEIGAAPANHTHEYLPLTGGEVNGNVNITGTLTTGAISVERADINVMQGNVYAENIEANTSLIADSVMINGGTADQILLGNGSTTSLQALKNAISSIPKFSVKVTSALPATGDASTIYLLKSGGDEGNLYTEYLYVNGAWEMLGAQSLNLSEYAKVDDLNDVNNRIPVAANATDNGGDIEIFFENASGKYLFSSILNLATPTSSGLMSAADKTKLDNALTEHQKLYIFTIKVNGVELEVYKPNVRAGEINLTPEILGAAEREHTHPYLPLSGNAATASKWNTARTITIGNTGKSVDGSSNVSWSLSEIGAAPANHTHDYAATHHTHSYLPLTGGTITGSVELNNNTFIRTDGTIEGKGWDITVESDTETNGYIKSYFRVGGDLSVGGNATVNGELHSNNISGTGDEMSIGSGAGFIAIKDCLVGNTVPTGPGSKWSIETDGNAYFNTVSQTSDQRLKENIHDVDKSFADKYWSTENGLIHEYDWKKSGKHANGMIAQELLNYIPEAVNHNVEDDSYSVDYTSATCKIIGAMFQKIKELEETIHALEER